MKISNDYPLFPTIFVNLKGRNDIRREYLALISSSFYYSIITRVDAYLLGFAEAVSDVIADVITRPHYLTSLVGVNGFIDAPMILMDEVTIGNLTFKNLEFITYDLPPETGLDIILGKNFLEKAKARIDYRNRVIEIEE